jgi:hypothetical protein
MIPNPIFTTMIPLLDVLIPHRIHVTELNILRYIFKGYIFKEVIPAATKENIVENHSRNFTEKTFANICCDTINFIFHHQLLQLSYNVCL